MVDNAISFAKRTQELQAEGAYAVLARAQQLEAQGREIIHLEIGQPDFDTYAHISLTGIRAISTGKTGYNPPAGILELRQALAQDAGQRRGVSFSPNQVIVAPGAKPLLFFPMLALLDAGDEVIYPDPGFPTYEAAILVAGASPVPVPLDQSRDFDVDLAAFDRAIGPKTRMIVLNTPGNPTGGVLSADTLEHIAQAARRYNCWVMADEIYAQLVYGEPVSSIVSLPGMMDRTILVDGFSKTYAMTGWRLGFGIMPEPLAQKVALLLTHSVGCTATFTQLAGVAAILGPQDDVLKMHDQFQIRRDIMIEGLNAIPGISCPTPRGAFYAFPNVSSFGQPVEQLAGYLLEEAGVALLPGTAFGANGQGHLRLSYANSADNIRKALDRMARALGAL